MLHVTLSRVNACETITPFFLSHNPEEICRYAHKTRIFIHLTFIYPPLGRLGKTLHLCSAIPIMGAPQRSVTPGRGRPEPPAAKRQFPPMNQTQEPQSERRLVKAVYIYSNGDTLERSWASRDQRQRPVSIVTAHENGCVREFPNHYQVFLRIEKPSPDAKYSRQTIFAQAVNILTKMLKIVRKSVTK